MTGAPGGIPPLSFDTTATSGSDGQFRSGDVFFGTDSIAAASQLATGNVAAPRLAESRFRRSNPDNLAQLVLIGAVIIGGVILWRRR